MDGPGSDPEADPGCANYSPPEASADWYEFVVQPADGETFDRSKTVTWTVKGTTTDGFQVCFGAPYQFVPSRMAARMRAGGHLARRHPGIRRVAAALLGLHRRFAVRPVPEHPVRRQQTTVGRTRWRS